MHPAEIVNNKRRELNLMTIFVCTLVKMCVYVCMCAIPGTYVHKTEDPSVSLPRVARAATQILNIAQRN